MLVRLHRGLPANIPAGMFILSGGTLLTSCDGVGIEFTAMAPDELRNFAALISSIADDMEASPQALAASALAASVPLGSA